ncbi:type IV pilin protein [Candidatus Colwellia aromaticivorans]|uniref:type IV pilin protein n=1 Tax=Candidatus Colwellia aromaticivorans TaxID=2267621 RepID=UPI000DF19551|nr:type IV pilin protein [Candidatus Colwellia aromaticivorans]
MDSTKKSNGFTLMELMIVVAIIGIIASIALPSYQDSVRKSRRAEAHAGLVKMQLQQEGFRMVNIAYATAIAAGANNVNDPGSDYYTFSIVTVAATVSSAYTLKAAATSGSSQAADTGCTSITIDQAGTKSPAGCW